MSRYRSLENHAMPICIPFAIKQKSKINHIQSRRSSMAIANGIKTPRTVPHHNVTSGFGSGLKML